MKKFLGRRDKSRSTVSDASSTSVSSLTQERTAKDSHILRQTQYAQSKSNLAEVDEVKQDSESISLSLSKRDLIPVSDNSSPQKTSKQDTTTIGANRIQSPTRKIPSSVIDTRKSTSLLKSLSSKRSNASFQPSSTSSKAKIGTQSLIDPAWDHEITKFGWLNMLSENAEEDSKLVRAELKGTMLYIYKPPHELSDIKSFKPSDESGQLSANDLKAQTTNSSNSTNISTIHTTTTNDDEHPEINEEQGLTNVMRNSNASYNSLLDEPSPTITSKENVLTVADSTNPESNDHIKTLLSSSERDAESNPTLIDNHHRLEHMNSPTSLSNIDALTNPTTLVKLSYNSTRFPHPDLMIDPQTGVIVNGTLESICHAIIFNPHYHLSKNLLQILPLLDDLINALAYFQKFSEVFVKIGGTESRSYQYQDDETGPVLVTSDIDLSMTKRLVLVIEVIRDRFPGMLLDDQILTSVCNLLLTIDPHQNCDQLRQSVYQKQQSLASLTNFGDNNLSIPFFGDEFMSFDIHQLAQQINAISLKFNNIWDPKIDPSLLYEITQENYTYWRKNPLIFNTSKNIHYLGRLLNYHLFEDPKYSKTAKARGMILTKWIQMGSLFDKMGDMVSWLAIATTICSTPILRLTNTWSTIDPNIIKLVSTDWAPVVFELDRRSMVSSASHRSSYHVLASQGIGKNYNKEKAVPYFGDLFIKKSQPVTHVVKSCHRHLDRVNASFAKWEEYLSTVENETSSLISDEQQSSQSENTALISKKLSNVLQKHIMEPPLSLSNIMENSLLVEPSYTGQYNRYHDLSRSPLFLGSYASILFPQILDTYSIYDYKSLLGALGGGEINVQGKVVTGFTGFSGSGTTAEARKVARNQFVKNVRDLFNIDSTELHVGDSIIFKTIKYPGLIGENHQAQWRQRLQQQDQLQKNYVSRSRPTSVLLNENANIKRFSSYSSSSFNLEDYISIYRDYVKDTDAAIQLSAESKTVVRELTDGINHDKDPQLNVEILTKSATLEKLLDLLVLTSSLFGSKINEEDAKRVAADKKSSTKIKSLNVSNMRFKMDNGVFTLTFFATYRGFCSTTRLLEGLTRRFVGAKSAALSIANDLKKGYKTSSQKEFAGFPNWDSNVTGRYSEINWKYVAQIQLGILETVLILVQDYYHHFVDDLQIKVSFDNLLRIIDNETIIQWTKVISWLEVNEEDKLPKDENYVSDIQTLYEDIIVIYKKMRKIYVKKCYKPQVKLLPSGAVSNVNDILNFTSELSIVPADKLLPNLEDISSVETFISQIDSTVESIFKHIDINDWIDTFEILEVRTSKSPLSLFSYDMQKINSHEDLLVISNIYIWLSTLLDYDPADNRTKNQSSSFFANKLPISVKSLFLFYFKLKSYLTSQLTDHNISAQERAKRMASVLLMVQICRVRTKSTSLSDGDKVEGEMTTLDNGNDNDNNSNQIENGKSDNATEDSISLRVPSLIESCLIDTILSPESRFFSSAWINAADLLRSKLSSSSPGTSDTLEEMSITEYRNLSQLLPEESITELHLTKSKGSLSPCAGWIVGRLLEISCFNPNMSIENTNLINFDKRRFEYNCISNIMDMIPQTTSEKHPRNTAFGFLFDFHINLNDLKLDYELASKENNEYNGGIQSLKIFKDHVDDQVRLMDLEHTKKAFLKKQETKKLLKSRAPSAINDKASVGQDHKAKFSGKTSVIRRDRLASKSISSYSSVSTGTKAVSILSAATAVSTPSSRFKFSGLLSKASRPFSSISMTGSNQPIPDRLVYAFELPPCESCIDNNSNNSKLKPFLSLNMKDYTIFPVYRSPCAFQLSSSVHSTMQLSFQGLNEQDKEEWIHQLNFSKKHWYLSRQLNKALNNSSTIIFGVPLEYVCMREGKFVPCIIEKLMSEIEYRGLEEVGIYRKSASLSVLNQIKDQINSRGDFNMENHLVFDIHNLTGCIKLFLRELPEPLIDDEIIPEFDKIKELAKSSDRFQHYKLLLSKLPVFNYHFLERFIRHLKLVDEYKNCNKMNSTNLATVLGGTFIEGCRPENMKRCFGLMNFVCEDLIVNYEKVFPNNCGIGDE